MKKLNRRIGKRKSNGNGRAPFAITAPFFIESGPLNAFDLVRHFHAKARIDRNPDEIELVQAQCLIKLFNPGFAKFIVDFSLQHAAEIGFRIKTFGYAVLFAQEASAFLAGKQGRGRDYET